MLVEFAEKLPDAIPAVHLSVRIEVLNDKERQFTFVAKGKKSMALLEELKRIVDREP